MDFGKICNLDNLMLPAGISIMVCGQVKLQQYLLLILDGFICLQILFHFTVLFLDFKVSSLDKLQLGQMTGRVHITIGFMRDRMLIVPGIYLKECGDGLNGKMEQMFCLLINPKQDGTIFQIVDLTLNKTQDMENIIQNMFIITIYILTYMKSQDKQEELKEHPQTNSFKKVNSLMKPDGDNT